MVRNSRQWPGALFRFALIWIHLITRHLIPRVMIIKITLGDVFLLVSFSQNFIAFLSIDIFFVADIRNQCQTKICFLIVDTTRHTCENVLLKR